jgi:hypothetical protein
MPNNNYKDAVALLSEARVRFILQRSKDERSQRIMPLLATLMVGDALEWECKVEAFFANDPAVLASMGDPVEFDFD